MRIDESAAATRDATAFVRAIKFVLSLPTKFDAPRVACPKRDSQLLHALLRTIDPEYYRCEDCAEVFAVDAPLRESRLDPERRRKK